MKTNLNPGASPEAIRYHYDIGNEFYRLFTEGTVSYSAALWEKDEPYENHEKAQLRKLDYHIHEARAHGAKRVLDVGCGWGGMLKRLVETHGCEQVVGLTLSDAQSKYIASLKIPRSEVRVESWSDHNPKEPYDAIISMGAFEHFAKLEQSIEEKIAGYRAFFTRCHQWLRPGGWISLQTMAYGTMSREKPNYFIAKDIFPESDLPYLADIIKATDQIFEIGRLRNDRLHYGRTYRAWYKKLKANRDEAIKMVGEELVARYEEYFLTMVYGFELGQTDLLRISLHRIDRPMS
jgi:cyclopropane-fatty-acyl-phospholipid synthase